MSAEDQGSRTEEATPRRKQEFRSRGDYPNSRDVVSVAALAGGATAGLTMAGASATALTAFTTRSLGNLDAPLGDFPTQIGTVIATAAGPVALGAMAAALLAGGIQLGWPPALKWPGFSLGNVFSPQSLSRIFALRQMAWQTLISTAKVAVVGAATAVAAAHEYRAFMDRPALELHDLLGRIGSAMTRLTTWAVVALAALAAVDYFKNRRSLRMKMRMSKSDIKREHKEQEGDPQIKARRRRRMRDLVRKRIAVVVPKADVVVVNPTHFAVALRYRAGSEAAPRVLCKGRGPVAARIRELARKAGVPIVSEPPLARMLYKLVPEGREIPTTLYKAVAEVLAYVYRLRRRGSSVTERSHHER
jgi:flagellar biosynthetic protein FlhB